MEGNETRKKNSLKCNKVEITILMSKSETKHQKSYN